MLAHELGHIILNSRGFAAFYREKPNNPESASLVHEIAQELFNCFPDELIDRATAKRGFTPRLLLQTYVHSTEENLNNSKAGDFESSSDTARKAYALGLFCTGMRLPTRSMRRHEEKVKAKYGPTLIERERTLSKQFEGLRCQMDDSAGCFHLTQKLRDAVGMQGVIVFADPLTHQPE